MKNDGEFVIFTLINASEGMELSSIFTESR